MLEARVIVAPAALQDRLAKHPRRACETDPQHGDAEPVLGTIDLFGEINAAVYVCPNDRCIWRRFDKLAL